MQLSEMTGDFEKVRAITYNARMDKAVYHQRMVRQVCGCVYAGEPEPDAYGSVYYTIYARYPSVDVALYVDKTNHWRTDEELAERFAHAGYDTKENFVESMKKRIEAGDHIRFTEVEFLKHIAPELEAGALKSRKVYAERRQKKEEERRAKSEAEDAAFVEQRNTEAFDAVHNAVCILKDGGTLVNETVTFYKDRWNYSSYSIINYLMDANGITLPIRTRGWINDSLKSITIAGGACVGYRYMKSGRGRGSSAVWEYLAKLMAAVKGVEAA